MFKGVFLLQKTSSADVCQAASEMTSMTISKPPTAPIPPPSAYVTNPSAHPAIAAQLTSQLNAPISTVPLDSLPSSVAGILPLPSESLPPAVEAHLNPASIGGLPTIPQPPSVSSYFSTASPNFHQVSSFPSKHFTC